MQSGHWWNYGSDSASYLSDPAGSDLANPMDLLFPKEMKCNFHK